MVLFLLIAAMFTVMQIVSTEERKSITSKEYLDVASVIVQKIAKDYGVATKNSHLSNFPAKWEKFQNLVQKAKEKNIYEADTRRYPGNIYAFNNSVSLPLFVGLKFALGETEKELLSTIAKNCDFTDIFEENCKSDKFKIVKEDHRLWSKDFIIEEYKVDENVQNSQQINANNKFSAMWNYVGGLNLSTYDFNRLSDAKKKIESQENVTVEHLKFTPLLLVPGISPITIQTTHAKLLSIAYAYLAVGYFGIDEYDRMLMGAYRKRFPEQSPTLKQEDMKYLDIVRYVAEKVNEKSDTPSVQSIEEEYSLMDNFWSCALKDQQFFNEKKYQKKIAQEKTKKIWYPRIIIVGSTLIASTLLFFVCKKWFTGQKSAIKK